MAKKPVKAKRKPSIKERQTEVFKKKAAEKLVTVLGRRKASEISYQKAEDPKHRIKTAAFPEKEKRRIGEKGVKAREAEIKEKSKKRTEAKKAQAIKEYKESKVGKAGGQQRTYLQPQDTRRSVVPAGERKTLKEPPKAPLDKYRGGPPATTGERGLTVPDKGEIPKDKSLVKYKSKMPATTGGGAMIPPSFKSRLLQAAGRAAGPASTVLMGGELADFLWEKQKEGKEYKLFSESELEIPRPFQKGGTISPGASGIYPGLVDKEKPEPKVQTQKEDATSLFDKITYQYTQRWPELIQEDQKKQDERGGGLNYKNEPFDMDDRDLEDGWDFDEIPDIPNPLAGMTADEFIEQHYGETPLSLEAEGLMMEMEAMPEKKETEDYGLEAALIAALPMAIGAAFQGEAGLAIGAEAGGEAAVGLLGEQIAQEKKAEADYQQQMSSAIKRNMQRDIANKKINFDLAKEKRDRAKGMLDQKLKFMELKSEIERKNIKTKEELKNKMRELQIDRKTLQETIRHHKAKEGIDEKKIEKELAKITNKADKEKQTAIAGLRKSIESNKGFNDDKTVKKFYGQIKAVMSAPPTAAGDISMIFSYMKILDPASVVRESEQETARRAEGMPGKIGHYYRHLMTGEKLTPSQRQDFFRQAKNLMIGRYKASLSDYRRHHKAAKDLGANPDDIVPDFTEIFDDEPIDAVESKFWMDNWDSLTEGQKLRIQERLKRQGAINE